MTCLSVLGTVLTARKRELLYMGTSLIRNYQLLGPCSRLVLVVLTGWVFLMSEVPLYTIAQQPSQVTSLPRAINLL